ncbi:MAG TPA: ROK family protein [Candidatus Limnocylindrales bacterium]|nr:ROK family protein [Candidatus Limnocylindrales bacterium]
MQRLTEPVGAIDFGGTHLRTAVVVEGRVIGRQHGPSAAASGARQAVEAAVASLQSSLKEHAAGGGRPPVAVGVSAPGPLDPFAGVLLDPPNLHRSFHDFSLADALTERLGMPVYLDRDTQVAALGEGAFGAAIGLSDYVYVTVSTGIGGAVVIDGRLLRGARGLAGEIGHLQVELDGPPCGCGARGHLEAMSSGTGISRTAMEALAGGAGRGSALAEAARRVAPRPVSAAEVAAAEEAGDELAAEVMEVARRAFAAAMVSVVDVFAPQRVVVGGGVAIGQGERLLGPAREAVARYAFREQARQVEIVPAALGDDVGLLGAAVLVEERLRDA